MHLHDQRDIDLIDPLHDWHQCQSCFLPSSIAVISKAIEVTLNVAFQPYPWQRGPINSVSNSAWRDLDVIP